MRPIESRIAAGRSEVRTAGEINQIVGYAAPFGTETVIGNNFRERIMPGAFRDVLGATPDVCSLFNHDRNYLLARTTSGTLRLSEDAQGLRYEADVNPNDRMAVDVAARVTRGDVTGSSFSFRVAADGEEWTRPTRSGDLPLRTIHKVDLLRDVGPVTFPAYNESTAEARDQAAALMTEVPAEARVAMTPQEGEEAAELVQYQTAAAALAQAGAALATATGIVTGLITAEIESPTETVEAEDAEEELETAQLRSLLVLCGQICGAVSGVSALAQAMLSDEYDPILYARSAATTADEDRARRLRLAQATR